MGLLYKATMDFSAWLWGTPMLVLLLGGGVILSVTLGFFQIRYFGYILSETFGKLFEKPQGEGSVSPFQAASAALASTIGASNIVGIPVAIAFGGPGAIFWMSITALIGSATKFSEIVLGLKYRERNAEGEYVGGPQFYLDKGLKAKGFPMLGKIFAFFLMLEIIPSVATQTASVVHSANSINIPNYATGIILMLLIGAVVFGGLKRIVQITEKMVPLMGGLYVFFALIVVFVNIKAFPSVIELIFAHAFTPAAATGGFVGASIAQAISRGAARGTYSNEAGMGTAPIAHATAITDHPVRQAFWGIFEIIVDTFLIGTITAFVVLVTGIWQSVPSSQAASMPALAFQHLFGNALGGSIVTISIALFVISTMIVLVFYGEKQAEYLFGLKFSKVMRIVYLLAIVLGAFGGIEFLYSFLDLFLAAIIIPNMIGLMVMRNEVKELKNEFFSNSIFYPKAKSKITQNTTTDK